MDLILTADKLKELPKYPEIFTAITQASEHDLGSVELDLAVLAAKSPYALSEAVLYARALGLRLILVAK